MANIDISNLDNSGSDLFNDAENFLTDLNEQESGDVVGGWGYPYYYGGYYNNQNSVISQNGNTVNANSFGNVNTVVQQ
jgi:hypothetical protein